MIQPICFYSVAKRITFPPNAVFSPIFFPMEMIQHTPNCGFAYFDYCGNRVDDLEKAGYVVYPNTMPTPPGFRWCGGAQPVQEAELWQANVEILSHSLYFPSEPQHQNSAPQISRPSSAIVSPSVGAKDEELEDSLSLVETSQGYGIVSAKTHRKTRATNYLLRDVIIVHHLRNGKEQDEISIRLMIQLVSPSAPLEAVEVAVSELDSVGAKIGKKIGAAIVYPGVKTSFFSQFSILIRERLAHCQHQYVYLSTGWVMLPQGQWAYVHDGGKPPYDNIVFRSGFKFETPKNGCSPNWLIPNAWRLLSLSQDVAAILIPFLFAHLSLLWSLFNAAGYPPHMILFIKGTTGSLKTAVASLIFNFSGVPENNIPASFRDTSASMEVRIEQYRDRALLVDDFCPAASENTRRVLDQNLEQLIRFYGDGIAKGRTNPRLEEVTEKKPQGLCVITGEDSSGSFSSLLRCLFVVVEPDTYNKQLLAEFQANPTHWTAYLKCFVEYCANNAPQIVNFIQSEFPAFRDLGGQFISERRLADACADLCIATKILLEFGHHASIISTDEKDRIFSQFKNVILDTCARSAEEAKGMNPVKIFAHVLTEGIEKRSILLATREEFELAPDKFAGYEEDGYWYFWGSNLYDSIRREYSMLDKRFPLSQSRLWEALYIANVLVPSKSREKSGSKFEYGVRVSFGNRPRLIRIAPAVLKTFL